MKKYLAMALAVAVMISMAGCSSNSTSDNADTWIIATDTAFMPFEYTDENGDFVGIDVDILDGAVAAVQSSQADALIAGADITSWEDLRGQNVAVKNGTTGADCAESLQGDYGFTISKFDDSPTGYQDILAGNSAACFDDTPVMAANIPQNNLALEIPEGFENEGSPYGFAIMDEANMELLEMFNTGLANIMASGEYDDILTNYLG